MITNDLTLSSFLSGSSTNKSTGLDSLVSELSGGDSSSTDSSSNSFDPAVNLDLSPEAQKVLQQYQQTQAAAQTKVDPQFSQPFTFLSQSQQNKITDIIKSFKDEPLNKDTFTKITDALKDAGFGAEKLTVMDAGATIKKTSFLTAIFAAGKGAAPAISTPDQNMASMQSKEKDYLQGVYNFWQATTTQTAEPDDSTDTGTATVAE